MKMRVLLATAAVAMALSQPAAAQSLSIVHDPTSLAKSLVEYRNQLRELQQQVQNGRDMINQGKDIINQGKELYGSFNDISNIRDVGQLLNDPTLRQFLPADSLALGRALDGDWEALGSIGDRASAIREENRAWTMEDADATEADLDYAGMLDRRGNLAARDIAVGEHIDATATRRQEGLTDLQTALNSADSARAVFDIQARAAIESSLIANDNMRLQGMAMRQEAERELEKQRYEEGQQARRQTRMEAMRRAMAGGGQ